MSRPPASLPLTPPGARGEVGGSSAEGKSADQAELTAPDREERGAEREGEEGEERRWEDAKVAMRGSQSQGGCPSWTHRGINKEGRERRMQQLNGRSREFSVSLTPPPPFFFSLFLSQLRPDWQFVSPDGLKGFMLEKHLGGKSFTH